MWTSDFALRQAAAAQAELADSSVRCAYRTLAMAVLQCAIRDAKLGKIPALAWFHSKDEHMHFWCEVLGMDADTVAERVIEAVESGRSFKYGRPHV